MQEGVHTEDKLLDRGEHVDGDGDLKLVALELKPFDKGSQGRVLLHLVSALSQTLERIVGHLWQLGVVYRSPGRTCIQFEA